MNVILGRNFFNVLMAIVIIGSIAACAKIREVTYPQDFTYMEKARVEGLMREMGASIAQLGELVQTEPVSELDKQLQVISQLNKLESIATNLSSGHEKTNQIFISEHIEQFISDIGTAKLFSKLSPPNYSKASELTSSCQDCHQSR